MAVPVVLGSAVNVTMAAGSSLKISGAVNGSGRLMKSGDGALILSGSNAYTGGTFVSQGTLVFDAAAARPSGDVLAINREPAGAGPVVMVRGDAANIAAYQAALLTAYAAGYGRGAERSSADQAASEPGHGIGYLTGAQFHQLYGATALLSGQTVAPADVILKYTYAGDADLSGKITLDDFAAIDAGFCGAHRRTVGQWGFQL